MLFIITVSLLLAELPIVKGKKKKNTYHEEYLNKYQIGILVNNLL